MTQEQRLQMLKYDLRRPSFKDDELLYYLGYAASYLETQAVRDDKTPAYDGCLVSFASFLIRQRDNPDMSIPPFINLEIKNLRTKQALK